MISIDVRNKDAVITALNIIQDKGVIIYPTDTIYGFGVDATNDEAIHRLNIIKGRSGPMSVLVPDEDTALSWADISSKEMNLVKSKLTGYSTIIYPIIDGIVSHKILGRDHTLGVRIPQNNFCNQLAKFSTSPITTTSVNRHGNTALNEPGRILAEFGKEIDLFVNGGNSEGNKESSIFKLEHGKLVQLRG